MSSVIIHDQYQQAWKIEEDDILYPDAVQAYRDNEGRVPVWPLEKITEHRPWGWWTVFRRLDEFEISLEQQMWNPGKQRLVDMNHEYTPDELRHLLQYIGSCLSVLHRLEGLMRAEVMTLKNGLKVGMKVAMGEFESRETTLAGREAELLAANELFRQTKRMEIDLEATFELVKGWRASYVTAWETTSRLITLTLGEADLQTDRHE